VLNDFISLFYPELCVSCGNNLFKHEAEICNRCYLNLPRSEFHRDAMNPVAKLFHGRVDVFMAGSYYLFNKEGSVQKILHQLKYKGNQEVGVTIGKWYGDELRYFNGFAGADIVVPVPLHRSKFKKRGYNQSACFARGIAKSMKIEIGEELLTRKEETQTQTRKGRFDRWLNVADKFEITDKHDLTSRHIILADDVVTTGATLEACVHALKKAGNVKVSIATIAYAQQL
jgi:ComF family protein